MSPGSHDDEEAKALQEKMAELQDGEHSFEVWVKSLSDEQKHMALRLHLGDDVKWDQISRYLICVMATQTHQGCGKCRYRSCEKCDLSKAQNYALRNADTPAWWERLKKALVSE